MDTKFCPRCQEDKDVSAFGKNRSTSDGLASYCKGCHNAISKEWRENNPEKRDAMHARWRQKRKLRILEHYGRICQCCGEDNPIFLCIDHINNNGAQHRREIGGSQAAGASLTYWWLIKNNFPSGFQVLCYNCNNGRQHNGGICPHQEMANLEAFLDYISYERVA